MDLRATEESISGVDGCRLALVHHPANISLRQAWSCRTQEVAQQWMFRSPKLVRTNHRRSKLSAACMSLLWTIPTSTIRRPVTTSTQLAHRSLTSHSPLQPALIGYQGATFG